MVLPSAAVDRMSERNELRPVVTSPTTPTATSSHGPTIHVLNSPHLTLQSSLEGACQLGEKRRQGVSIANDPIHFEFAPTRKHQSLSGANDSSQNDTQSDLLLTRRVPQTPGCSSGSELPIECDAESSQQQRSTLADALSVPTRGFSTFTVEDTASTVDNGDVTANNQPA